MWLIWLLLFAMMVVISAYAGYWYRTQEEQGKPVFSGDYLTGINFIINDETDKAVDHFIKMLAVDSDTVETHLALGKLFRRRGEVDRAIRIHQNLIARPTLDDHYRDQSFFALGCDYLSAGMLDRAEKIFLELAKTNTLTVAEPALVMLLDIYQQEKSWQKAIETAVQLQMITKKDQSKTIAHFYCELAENAMQRHDQENTLYFIEQAICVDNRSVRAYLMRSNLCVKQQQYEEALAYLKKIAEDDPRYLSILLPHIVIAFEMLAKYDELRAYLQSISERYPASGILQINASVLQKQQGMEAATAFVKDFVRKHPSIAGVVLYLQLATASLQGQTSDDLFLLQNIMKKMLAKIARFQCIDCGFSGNTLHWLCPGCKQWGSVLPLAVCEEKLAQS